MKNLGQADRVACLCRVHSAPHFCPIGLDKASDADEERLVVHGDDAFHQHEPACSRSRNTMQAAPRGTTGARFQTLFGCFMGELEALQRSRSTALYAL